MSQPTIRERLHAIAHNLAHADVTPDMARDHLVALTGLLDYVSAELRAAEHEYNVVRLATYKTEGKANRAELVAQISPEYERYRVAKDSEKQVEQMIVTCRTYLRSLDSQMRLAR